MANIVAGDYGDVITGDTQGFDLSPFSTSLTVKITRPNKTTFTRAATMSGDHTHYTWTSQVGDFPNPGEYVAELILVGPGRQKTSEPGLFDIDPAY